jgi:rod shape-determining protein MreD
MQQLKIAVVVALAVILQTSLRQIWPPLVHIDLPLIVTVYFALQRDVLQAMLVGAITGLAADALSGGGLLGAGGFSLTLTAYLIATLATRVMLDNPLVRIPVIAGAALFDATVFVLLHRMLDQPSQRPFVETASYKVIWTTVAGTIVLYVFDMVFSERARQRRQLSFRRRVARRGMGRFRRKR